MKPDLHFELSTKIEGIQYALNPITNKDDQILGFDCEFTIETSMGKIFVNFESVEDLDKTIDLLKDIASAWRKAEADKLVDRWIKRN